MTTITLVPRQIKSQFTKEAELLRQMLLQARIEAGVSQRELCARLTKPTSFVSKYEKGERRLDVVEFLQICRVLRLDASKFIRTLELMSGNPHARNFKKSQSGNNLP